MILTPSLQTTDEQESVEAIRRWGFREYVRQAWSILEPATQFVDNWHIDCLCDHLQAVTDGQLRKIIFNLPPGGMKSLVISVFWPSWHWTKLPADRFLTASYTDVLSIRDALKSRRVIQSQWYQNRWGDRFRLTGDQNAKSRYDNDKTGYRIATHVGGATGERAKIRILDDPHNIEDAESDAIRESTVNWVRTTWSEREADPRTSADIVVMQRLHQRDVSGVLLEDIGGFEHVMLPMRFETARASRTMIWHDPRTREGELLWPIRWDETIVQEKEKRLGAYSAAGQLQQRPAPEHGGILQRHWFRYWQRPGDSLPPVMVKLPNGTFESIEPVELPYTFDRVVQSWDMTFDEGKKSDYVVGQQYGVKEADTFLIDQVRGQMDFVKTLSAVEAFNQTHQRYGGKKLVEKKANGAAIISSLQRKIPGFVPHPGNDDKVARAHAYAHLVESGNFFLPHPHLFPWVEAFIEECTVYPNGAYDDQVVAWSQAMDDLHKVEETVPITPEYQARFHLSPAPIVPMAGVPTFRFWFDGVYPCCVIGQQHPGGRLVLIHCVVGEANTGLVELIERKVAPLLAEHYRGVKDWRDVSNHPPSSTPLGQYHAHQIIFGKLGVRVRPGEPNFLTRVNAIKVVLAQTGRFMVNAEATPGEEKHWIHVALNGGYAYSRDQYGTIRRGEARKLHPLSSVGDAIGHGFARLVAIPANQAPRPPQTSPKPMGSMGPLGAR